MLLRSALHLPLALLACAADLEVPHATRRHSQPSGCAGALSGRPQAAASPAECGASATDPEEQLFSLLQVTASVHRVSSSSRVAGSSASAAPALAGEVAAAVAKPNDLRQLWPSPAPTSEEAASISWYSRTAQRLRTLGYHASIMLSSLIPPDSAAIGRLPATQLHAASQQQRRRMQSQPPLAHQRQPEQQHEQQSLSLEVAEAATPFPAASAPSASLVQVRADLASASEGDVVQGFILIVVFLIVVCGLYLLVFNDARADHDAQGPWRVDKSSQKPLGAYTRGGGGAAASNLLASRVPGSRLGSSKGPPPTQSSRSLAQEVPRASMRPGPHGMPGTPGTFCSTQPTLPGMTSGLPGTMGRHSAIGSMSALGTMSAQDWYQELPRIYPQLVMPMAHTRLAVPLPELRDRDFEVDVLGLSGVPLLSVALDRGGARGVLISLHSVGTLLAIVTPQMEILCSDGTHVGVLKEERGSSQTLADNEPWLVLRDREGRPIMVLATTRRDSGGRDFKLSYKPQGLLTECATAVRRPALRRLPAEHYELVANPSVDAVLVLAVLLAAVVFEYHPGHEFGAN